MRQGKKRFVRRKKQYPEELPLSSDQFFRKLDRRVLELSESVGADTTKEHNVSFWMYLPTEESALALAKQLQEEYFDVDVTLSASKKKEWLCLAYRMMIPETNALEKIRKRLTTLVEISGGKYDGWEMEV